eukprot:8245356-Pyramimonas_sp.AAC.1
MLRYASTWRRRARGHRPGTADALRDASIVRTGTHAHTQIDITHGSYQGNMSMCIRDLQHVEDALATQTLHDDSEGLQESKIHHLGAQ